jgi:hypothetical protein
VPRTEAEMVHHELADRRTEPVTVHSIDGTLVRGMSRSLRFQVGS